MSEYRKWCFGVLAQVVVGLVLIILLAERCAGQEVSAVEFSIKQITGSVLNREITLLNLDGARAVGTNAYFPSMLTLRPSFGMVRTNLLIGRWRLSVAGLPGYIDGFVVSTNLVLNWSRDCAYKVPGPVSAAEFYTRSQVDALIAEGGGGVSQSVLNGTNAALMAYADGLSNAVYLRLVATNAALLSAGTNAALGELTKGRTASFGPLDATNNFRVWFDDGVGNVSKLVDAAESSVSVLGELSVFERVVAGQGFVGSGASLTNIPMSGVVGLGSSLAALTNKVPSAVTETFNIGSQAVSVESGYLNLSEFSGVMAPSYVGNYGELTNSDGLDIETWVGNYVGQAFSLAESTINFNGDVSVDFGQRQLVDSNGNVSLDWENRRLEGNWDFLVPDAVSAVTAVQTDASVNPTNVHITLNSGQNAVRVWTGDQPLDEAWFDIYVRTNGGTAFAVRMYRWQGRIINAAPNATISLGTANGRTLNVSAVTVPAALETVAGVTNTAWADKAGPPLWNPVSPHITLPSENSAFTFAAHGRERNVFISEYDGQQWTPLRWVRLEKGVPVNCRTTYRQVALANYDGSPFEIIAPTNSVIGGVSRRMEFPHAAVRTHYVSTVDEFQLAISNAVYGDEIVLSNGVYALTIAPTGASFASNNASGFNGPEGITIRGNSPDRERVVIGCAATNTGGWTIESGSTWTAPCKIADLTFDGSSNFYGVATVKLNGGKYQLQNIRMRGVQGAGDLIAIGPATAVPFPIFLDAVDVQLDNSKTDCWDFTGSAISGDCRIRLVNCSGFNPGPGDSDQVVTSHNGLHLELYGGYYRQAQKNVLANGADSESTRCFFVTVDRGTKTNYAGVQNTTTFSCDFNIGTDFRAVTNGYLLFSRFVSAGIRQTANSYSAPAAHNRFLNTSSTGVFDDKSGDKWVIGNIYTNSSGETFRVGYSSSATGTQHLVGNTVQGATTAFNLRDATLSAVAVNNAARANNTGLYVDAAMLARVIIRSNTIDGTITGFTMGDTNTTADASLDARWFPVAAGNSDAGTGENYLGVVGDSDPWGFVWIYGESLVPRGARARQVIYSGARLHPDYW